MKASIAICTRNRSESLRRTLSCLSLQKIHSQGALEILVIDNGSTDDTIAVVGDTAADLNVRYLREPRKGVAYARNLALEEFQGDCLVYLDDDVIVSQDWLPALIKPVSRDGFDGSQGHVKFPPHIAALGMSRQLAYYFALVDDGVFENGLARWVVSANFCIARRALPPDLRFDVELGPGTMGFCEDILFGKQLAALGRRIAAAPEAWVEHWFDSSRLTDQSACASAYRMGMSDAYINYHWMHNSETYIYARLSRLYLRRLLFRICQDRPIAESPLSSGLIDLCQNYRYEGYLRGMQSLRGCKRKYARMGIKKLGGILWENFTHE